MSDGNAPGTRAAGAGVRVEGKVNLLRALGLIRLNFEEVAGRRFDPCRRMEVDGGVGPDLHAARGNEGCSVRISTNVCEYGLGRARATSSHRVCVGTTFKNSILWIFSVRADTKRQVIACLPYPIDITVNSYSRHNAI